MGHDPAAFQVQILREAYEHYKKIMKTKSQWGANSARDAVIKANSELMKYCYPTRKAIEGHDGGAVSFAGLIQILDGEDNDPNADWKGPT